MGNSGGVPACINIRSRKKMVVWNPVSQTTGLICPLLKNILARSKIYLRVGSEGITDGKMGGLHVRLPHSRVQIVLLLTPASSAHRFFPFCILRLAG